MERVGSTVADPVVDNTVAGHIGGEYTVAGSFLGKLVVELLLGGYTILKRKKGKKARSLVWSGLGTNHK